MWQRFFIFSFCILLSLPLYSVELDHPLSLSELIDIALENNPATKQTWWNAQRAAAALGNAKSAYYPVAGLDVLAQHGRDFKFLNGPNTTYTIVGADMILSMLLYDFGERKAYVNAAKMSLLAAHWEMDASLQKVIIRVLENAYATLHAQELYKASLLGFEETEKLLKFAKELNRVGLSPLSDIFSCQANLYQSKMEMLQYRVNLDIQKAKLVTSLGLTATENVEIEELEPIQSLEFTRIEDLIALAMCQRADLMAKQNRLSETLYKQKAVRTANKPKVFFNGRGGMNRAFHDRENGGQYQLSLNVQIPLFDGFENFYESRMALADSHLSMEELAELQLHIAMEVLTFAKTLEAAQEMLPEACEYLKNSEKAYICVLEKYRAGKERIADVSYAQQQLVQARMQYSDIKTQWLVAMANLAYATGTLAPNMERSCEINP